MVVAGALKRDLESADPHAFAATLDREIRRRLHLFLAGVEAYRLYERPARRLSDHSIAWRDGTTRLVNFGSLCPENKDRSGIPVLAVPSLINRAYILDLSVRRSLMRWLAGRGLHPFLVDWGEPGPVERNFTLTDYIAGRLESALDTVLETTGRPPVLLGYCMGGLLSLALALRRQRDVQSLVLLATPWDFHADRPGVTRAAVAAAAPLLGLVDQIGEMPVDAIQAMFMALDPLLAARKFIGFAEMKRGSVRAEEFVALEDWINDGVPLAAPVARECILGWYGANTPMCGEWRVAGEVADPTALNVKSLVVVPERDRIVPPTSAEVLGRLIPHAQVLQPKTGHIGMIASAGAKTATWQPMADWIESAALESE